MNVSHLLGDDTQIQIDKELAKRGFEHFVASAWDEVEPSRSFVRSWNVGAVCDHLQAVANGEITRLVINVPPNTTKSMTCAVMLVPWVWTFRPGAKFIYGSYSDRLARRDSQRARKLIASDWYQKRWGRGYSIDTKMEDSGGKYTTSIGGYRMVTTVGGSVTGEHADFQIVDDPLKPYDVTTGSLSANKKALENVVFWWRETLATRLVDYSKSARVIVMQRLHEGDLAGSVLKEGGYEHLCLPMEYEPERKCFTSIGFEDPRTQAGELLCPERFPAEAVETLKRDLGPRGAQAQLQQDPVAVSGNLFKRDGIQYYRDLPTVRWDMVIQSWDCTFKETGGSYVVGQVWARTGANFYLLDQYRDRWSFSQTCERVKALSSKWPKAIRKLVEAKANGIAVVDHLRREITGLELVEPKGGKEARANAVEPYWTAKNIYIPHPENAPWVEAFTDELTKFPAATNDDQVDAMTQALSYMGQSRLGILRAAMRNVG